ncbi:hypothetical protein JCM8547_002236 [Rhodosporidiobolus lusitaniae]
MPSIKSCIASLAVVALAFGPLASASPVKADSLTRRTSNPTFYSNEAAVEKRESRKDSATRVKRAKFAAAKKAKRAAKANEAEELLKRAISEANEGLSTRDLEARDVFARALRRVRCGVSDTPCRRAVTAPTDLPANGAAVCNPVTHLCSVGCLDGFVLTGGACIANQATCGANTCGTVENGAFLCSGDNVCTLVCDTANGYQAVGGACVNTRTDAANCGAIGNVCPQSYNGVGTPSCKSGTCKLTCPAGTGVRRTQDLTGLYCYGTATA